MNTVDTSISASVPDWTREEPRKFWDPSRKFLRSVRRYQQAHKANTIWARLVRRKWAITNQFWSLIIQADIPKTTKLGGGLLLPHPNGIVIHPEAVIGPNCVLFQQVTIGTVATKRGLPVIGGHVDIGAGAKILGPVHIGDHSLIGANSVVTKDVPAYSVAIGIPAQIRPRSS